MSNRALSGVTLKHTHSKDSKNYAEADSVMRACPAPQLEAITTP